MTLLIILASGRISSAQLLDKAESKARPSLAGRMIRGAVSLERGW